MREVVFGQDGSFSFDALVQRYNADLANGYGNLTSRILAMITRYFDGVVPQGEAEPRIVAAAETAAREFAQHFEALDFSRALEALWALVAVVDGYITEKAPWKLGAAQDAATRSLLASILYTCAEALAHHHRSGLSRSARSATRGSGRSSDWAILPMRILRMCTGVNWRQEPNSGQLGPIFPRAEKDTVKRMNELENEQHRQERGSRAGHRGSCCRESVRRLPRNQRRQPTPVRRSRRQPLQPRKQP